MPIRPLVLAALALVSWPALGATYYVRATGDDTADGKSPQTAFKTVLRTAQVLNHGDSVVIGPGTYKEAALFAEQFGTPQARMAITGDESGKLTGDAAGPVVIVPASTSQPAVGFHRFQFLTISGLTFRGPGPGLRLQACREAIIERCTFDGLSTGLSVESCLNTRVESSVFAQCSIGASVRASVDTRLAHLTIAGCSTVGAMAINCGAGTVRNCIFTANNSNMIADKNSAPSWTSDYNVLTGATGVWGQVPVVTFPAEWFAASGQDRHSVHVAPAFVSPEKFDLHIDPEVRWGGGQPGMNVGATLEPKVALDRDGKPFRDRGGAVAAGAYDYPDPKPAGGWKVIGKLEGKGPRQSAGIYRPDGTLVRMLLADAAAVRELWWDGRDDEGRPAAAGKYEIRSAVHDVRLAEDGAVGDNGSTLGTYNCDNPDRVLVLPDGRFVVATIYDEAGIPLRFHSPSGRSILGANLLDKEFLALALDLADSAIIGCVMRPPASRLERILPSGERARMENGQDAYPIFSEAEQKTIADEQARARQYRAGKDKHAKAAKQWEVESARAAKANKTFTQPAPTPPAEPNPPLVTYEVRGLAVVNHTAYISLGGFNVVRVIDLATGQKKADWRVPAPGDIACDAAGALWIISGTDVVSLSPDGKASRKCATGLPAPRFLAAGPGMLAVGDPAEHKIALIDPAGGNIIRTIGKVVNATGWNPTDPEWFRALRGMAFFPDGRLLVALHGSVRAIWPRTGKLSFEQYSNFLDICVTHPTQPEYVYSRQGIMHVDRTSGAVTRRVDIPDCARNGLFAVSAVLGGRPFIGFRNEGIVRMLFDVSDPLKPRLAYDATGPDAEELRRLGFRPSVFGRDGAAFGWGGGLLFRKWAFKGLDAAGNPSWDSGASAEFGPKADPDTGRGMTHKRGLAIDPITGDVYYLAVTRRFNKMVPAWGADGTGVGRTTADGRPLWFSLSSGGNYQTIAAAHDGKRPWVLACKSFGGQVDVFDSDGLRLTTSNWGWLANWQCGFVDTIDGLSAYIRPDGKVGAYVEDDSIGRFLRARLDGAETLEKKSVAFNWAGGAEPGAPPTTESAGKDIQRGQIIPKVAALAVGGDWAAWVKAGVTPQVICLPAVTWGRSWPQDLFDSYKAGAGVAAFCHDGKSIYVYFLTTDDTPYFDAENPASMFCFDSIELWIEEEQFGLGFTRSGKPALFKYRYHNRAGKEWAANYPLPDDAVWGERLADVSTHPLGRMLENAVGTSLAGRSGYVLMARIPFEEIKLVGGIAGRSGITDATGKPGEIVRVGVAFDNVWSWGREQDFKITWPCSLMYSDPTRSVPFIFGE